MVQSSVAKQLYNEISKLAIIDAHEHLPPEKAYLDFQYSGLNFFAGYIQHDLVSSGLSKEFRSTMRDPGYKPVSDWWPKIAPYWDKVRNGSYARSAIITARDLYGIEEINSDSIEKLAACITADNKPGLYKRILGDRCGARVVLTCEDRTDYAEDTEFRVVPHISTDMDASGFFELEHAIGRAVNTLKDLVDASIGRLLILKASGRVVGFKTSSVIHGTPDEHAANAVFKSIKAGEECIDTSPLNDYVFFKLMEAALPMGLPVAVHAGVWGDFRALDPKNTIYLAEHYPGVHFDLFHLGIPMVRDAMTIAKNYRNVSLNLCWCPVVSQRMTMHALNELLDLVPLNKIIAFGGDYRCVVQKAWGHLVMAREAVAGVLAERVLDGEMSEKRALEIAKMWFHDNPSEIYKV